MSAEKTGLQHRARNTVLCVPLTAPPSPFPLSSLNPLQPLVATLPSLLRLDSCFVFRCGAAFHATAGRR